MADTVIVYTDGGARGNPGPAGAGAVITDASGEVLKEVYESLGNSTNNFAEYQAVSLGLRTLKKIFGKDTKILDIEIRLDSELVQKQLSHEYQIKDPGLVPLFIEIHNFRVANFSKLRFTHIPREENKHADALANKAMDES